MPGDKPFRSDVLTPKQFAAFFETHRGAVTRLAVGSQQLQVERSASGRRLVFTNPNVLVREVDGALRTTATTAAQRRGIDASIEAHRPALEARLRSRAEHLASLRALPVHRGFSRAEFAQLLATRPTSKSTAWDIDLNARDTVMIQPAGPHRDTPDEVLFVRRLKPVATADVNADYVRVWVYDVEGTLRTTARTPRDRAFADELFAASKKAVPRYLAAVAARSKVPSVKVDRAALTDFVSAVTFGKVDVAPLVDQLVLAATDPRAYIAANAAACDEFGIEAPVKGLYPVALLQQLPPAFVLDFDWKEATFDILTMLRGVLKAGPGLDFDPAPFVPRCPVWDRGPRLKALKVVAKSLETVSLVQVDLNGDTLVVVCLDRRAAKHVAVWQKRAKLKLSVL